ncbi:TPA: hypothetical protein N0F65_005304 [Lagenidium giganteum]|uniref:Uncharacterized protein n=1 Tax=Lagenidium giganteum TaxID=4803 RepID=A0AAV2Z210_9STRA|nr:TPA: hypothetical protein N0F65_005304 [Lagenidium giganteum]
MATTAAAQRALRDFLLAVERPKQALDALVEALAVSMRAYPGVLAQQWCEIHPQCEPLVDIWPEHTGADTRWQQRESIARYLEVFAHILVQLATTKRDVAESLAVRLVRDKHAQWDKWLTWSDKPVIEFQTLQFMRTLAVTSDAVARELVRLFHFQSQAFQKMAMRRWKPDAPAAPQDDKANDDDDDGDDDEDSETKPSTTKAPFQLREAFVRFVLALAQCQDRSVRRFALKDGGIAASLFKSVDGDPAELVELVLTEMERLVLRSDELDARAKSTFFSTQCVQQVLPLLQSESAGAADQALRFLRALFFDDGALYVVPAAQATSLFLSAKSSQSSSAAAVLAAVTDQLDQHHHTAGEVNNTLKMVRSVVVSIGLQDVIKSAQAQLLIGAFMQTYPALLAEYLQSLNLPLEPKPGFRWYCVASLVQKLLAMPLTQLQGSSAPSCTTQVLATRIILPLSCRKELSRGIQHPNNLVVYSTLGLIKVALHRAQYVATHVNTVVRNDLENELRGLLPSPEALLSLLMKLSTSAETSPLLYVRALGVFRLYHQCLPQMMGEVKADFTKLVAWNFLDQDEIAGVSRALHGLIVGEILRFLLTLEEHRLRFMLSSGAAGDSRLLQLLALYATSTSDVVVSLCSDVLLRVLAISQVFGVDPSEQSGHVTREIKTWLRCLRQSKTRSCACFLEQLVQQVQADPFLFVDTHAGSNRGAKLSPVVVALVAYFGVADEQFETVTTTSKARAVDASHRQNHSVAAFAARVLLSLLYAADAPAKLMALIAPRDDTTNASVNSASPTGSKKRKLPRASPTNQSDKLNAFQWLQAFCHVSLRAAQHVASPKRTKTTMTPPRWTSSEDVLKMPPHSFLPGLNDQVRQQNWVDPAIVALYVDSFVGQDVVHMVQQARDKAAKDKWQRLANSLPLPTLVQGALFSDEADGVSAFLHKLVFSRLDKAAMTTELLREVVTVACQVLFFLDTRDASYDGKSMTQSVRFLHELILRAVTLEKELDVECEQSTRLVDRLQALLASRPSHHLTALHLCTSKATTSHQLTPPESAMLPTTVLLADRFSWRMRLTMIHRLLLAQQSPATRAVTMHLVESLDSVAVDMTVFPRQRARALATKLWTLVLDGATGSVTMADVRFLRTCLHLIQLAGGVPAHDVQAAISKDVMPMLRAAATNCGLAVSADIVRWTLLAQDADSPGALDTRRCLQDVVLQAVKRQSKSHNKNTSADTTLVCACLEAFASFDSEGFLDVALTEARTSLELALTSATDEAASAAALVVLRSVVISHAREWSESDPWGKVSHSLTYNAAATPLTAPAVAGLLLALRTPSAALAPHDLPTLAARLLEFAAGIVKTVAAGNTNEHTDLTLQALGMVLSDGLKQIKDRSALSKALKRVLPRVQALMALVQEEREEPEADNAIFEAFVHVSAMLLQCLDAAGATPESLSYDPTMHLGALTGHSSFRAALASTTTQLPLLRVVYRLVRLANVYERQLFQNLLASYSVSMSPSDRLLRLCFEAFDERGGVTLAQVGYRFGASILGLSESKDHADLNNDSAWLLSGGLEPHRVRATIEHFPLERAIATTDDYALLAFDYVDQDTDSTSSPTDSTPYDPAFLLPMLAHFMSSSELPESSVINQGLLGLALRATSSNDDSMREYAYGLVAHLHEALSAETAEFRPGRQVHLLLDVFRNAIEEPLEAVPSVLSVFLNDAIAILMRPAHTLYVHVNHFLLARPAIDLGDVPMFYALFNSRTPTTYKQERAWLLHTLRRGIREDSDVQLLVRRHVLSILMSFYGSQLSDEHTQLLICQILQAALTTPVGSAHLLNKGGFFEWLAGVCGQMEGSARAVATLPALVSLLEQALQVSALDDVVR